MGRFFLSIVACIRNTTFVNTIAALAVYLCVAVVFEFACAAAYNTKPEFKYALMYYGIVLCLHIILKIKFWYNQIK